LHRIHLTMYILLWYNTGRKGSDRMTQVNFRIEEDVKNNAEKALKDMGLTMSSAITMFLVKVGREKRIPFEINADPFYSAENIAELERRVANLQNGSSVLKEHELIEVDDE